MDDALGDPLAVEVGHLVDEGDILQQQWAALADTDRGRLLAHRLAVARGDDGAALLSEREGERMCQLTLQQLPERPELRMTVSHSQGDRCLESIGKCLERWQE